MDDFSWWLWPTIATHFDGIRVIYSINTYESVVHSGWGVGQLEQCALYVMRGSWGCAACGVGWPARVAP